MKTKLQAHCFKELSWLFETFLFFSLYQLVSVKQNKKLSIFIYLFFNQIPICLTIWVCPLQTY
jgi:hypothetical protein